MFWGVTIESGKKYSQIVEASYHLSMAALEPIPKVPKEGNKFVSVMLEHQKSDFVLCTLEHGKTLQINLDLVFQEGEEVTFYLTGEGTVHLTGYIVGDLDSLSDEDSDQETEEVPKTTSVSKSPPKLILAEGADKASSSEDEDDDDWSPSAVLNASGKRPLNGADNSVKKLKQESSPEKKSPKKGSVLLTPKDEGSSDDDDDDDDDDEDDDLDSDEVSDMDDSDLELGDDDDEDDDDDDKSGEENNGWGINAFGGINKKAADSVPLSKKKKKQLAQQNAKAQTPQTNKNEQKVKNQTPQSVKGNKQQHQQKTLQTAKGDQNQKTPQQSGKKNQKTPNQFNQSSKKGKDIETSFSAQTPGGKKQKKQEQQTPNNQLNKSAQQSPKSGGKSKKLQGGVQVEDVLEGKGPVAKPGKYVHVYYTGKLPNNKEFDSLTKGKPFGFRLGKGEVIKGWDVALDGMKVGGKRKITVPPTMGYGGKSTGPIPPNSTLHFEVELKAVQ